MLRSSTSLANNFCPLNMGVICLKGEMTFLLDTLKTTILGFIKPNITDEQIRQHHYLLAKEGVVESMFNYAILCVSDFGGPRNLGHSEYWLSLAANKGLVDAQYFLGMLYTEGDYFEVNKNKANHWLSIAVVNGDIRAQRYFENDL